MKQPQTIPRKAKAEIAEVIERNGCISNNELDAILKKHRVRGDARALQRGYRLRAGQRLLASVRDEEGRREILAHRDSATGEITYVPIDLCNKEDVLISIQNRLHKSMTSLQRSSAKADNRVQTLQWIMRPFRIMGGKR